MEKLDVVDEEDRIIDSVDRKKAHEKGLRHSSVMFFVKSHKGNFLVTRRSEDKEIYPGYWSIVLGGHVRSGMSYDETLEKESMEEIGKRGEYHLINTFVKDIPEEKENVSLYLVKIIDEDVELLEEEFEEGYFWSMQKIEEELEDKEFLPETTTVLKEYKRWKND